MALGVTAYSEAAFSAEANDVIAYPQGITLTGSMGDESNTGTANVSVTGIQATITNGGAVGGSSVNVDVIGVSLASSIGTEIVDIGVPVTGSQLSISNLTFTQDSLTAFGESPFATLSPSTFKIPSVEVEATTGAGQLPSFQLGLSLGTFSVTADGNVSLTVTEHTMNSSVGSIQMTGDANISVTGISLTSSIGNESAFTDHTVEVTGQQLTMALGDEGTQANAKVTPTGISLTSSVGSASQVTIYDVSGIQMTTSVGSVSVTGNADIDVTGIALTSSIGQVNVTAWAEIDPGVSNVWTEVDLAA